MANSSQLGKNVGVVDPLVWSDDVSDSYFHYHGYSTIKNFFLVRKDITAEQTSVSLGQKTSFKLPIISDKVGPVQLLFKLAALGTTSLVDTPSYQDFAGLCAFEYIDLLYSTNDVYRLTPEEIWTKYRQTLGLEHREGAAECLGGDLSPTQRQARALDVQEFIVDLSFPFTRGTSRWLEIMQLAHEPRIEIQWKKLEDIVESTAPLLLTGGGLVDNSVKLRSTLLHIDGDERDENSKRTESENGVIRLFDEVKFERLTIPSGTTGEYRVKLNNFRNTSKKMDFFLRPASALNTPYGNNQFGSLIPITSWYLEATDGRVVEPIEDKYQRFYLHGLYHEAPPGEYIYGHSFAISPDDLLNATGSLNLGSNTNTIVSINFGNVQLGEDFELYVQVNEYNFMQQIRGDWIKNFK